MHARPGDYRRSRRARGKGGHERIYHRGGHRCGGEVREVPEEVLEEVVAALGERRGGVLSSGMEYPGRYSRWHLGYVDPCLEIVARGRRISARALNERGRVLLPAVASCLLAAGKPAGSRRRPRRGLRPRVRGGPHRGEAQPPAHRLHRVRGSSPRSGRGRAPGPVRRLRLRPGLPVRADPAYLARPPTSATWSCTWPTG